MFVKTFFQILKAVPQFIHFPSYSFSFDKLEIIYPSSKLHLLVIHLLSSLSVDLKIYQIVSFVLNTAELPELVRRLLGPCNGLNCHCGPSGPLLSIRLQDFCSGPFYTFNKPILWCECCWSLPIMLHVMCFLLQEV